MKIGTDMMPKRKEMKPTKGWIVMDGTLPLEFGEGVLWRYSRGKPTLFTSYEQARSAARRTDRYAKRMHFDWKRTFGEHRILCLHFLTPLHRGGKKP